MGGRAERAVPCGDSGRSKTRQNAFQGLLNEPVPIPFLYVPRGRDFRGNLRERFRGSVRSDCGIRWPEGPTKAVLSGSVDCPEGLGRLHRCGHAGPRSDLDDARYRRLSGRYLPRWLQP
jgi:hypothetical protein